MILPGDEVKSEDRSYYDESSRTFRSFHLESVQSSAITKVPPAGSVVICRCVRITQRFAGVDIEAVVVRSPAISPDHTEEQAVKLVKPLKGTIRQQDIYALEELEVAVVHQCFRPGDVIRAQVIGRGDASAGLLLSTGTSVHLGVIYAESRSTGDVLQIVSWNGVLNPRTDEREMRKCARPF
jgi:exosome complex component CSL4